MQSIEFNNLINLIPSLDNIQKEKLYITLKSILGSSIVSNETLTDDLREIKFKDGLVCPHCKNHHVVRYGKHNNHQRYKCKDCNKTFSDLTFTPLNKTHHTSEEWIGFIECMINGYSLRKSAKILEINYVILFYWRHKILSALKQISIDNFEGIVEMDETYFLYSEKGKKKISNRKPRKRGGVSSFRGISHEQVCVLVARDRQKQTISKVTCMGRIVKSQVDEIIGSHITSDNIFCTDSWRAYMTYAKEKHIQHYRIKSDGKIHVIKGIYHIQNVNNYHQRLKKWLDSFNGVASKYLDNYLSWFRFLDSNGFDNTKKNIKDMLITSCLYGVSETYNSLRLSEFKV